ncbi:unnamed protein product [Parnassius apollo]|uniref:(apollo) hypothetical protein n=1 Tax=Parnassius apollo TaxID=110799 RepID=A0A8S3WF91_PARAO|nr:unnamed protein product [Parnassius apollo]
MATSRTCLLVISIHLIYAVTAQEMEKRVPQGFVGMRGKKYLDSRETEQFYKRKPQFFVGVKGKKNYDSSEYQESSKQVPMEFVGMQGKKEYPELLLLPDDSDFYPERFGSLFGKIDYTANEIDQNEGRPFADLIANYIQKLQGINLSPESVDTNEQLPNAESYERVTNEVDKRANFHQFYGVRGKKSVQKRRPYDLSFRGKFIGVRGKKDLQNSGTQEIKFLLEQNGPWPKRKAQMGFFGMRGKKWTDESSPEATPN